MHSNESACRKSGSLGLEQVSSNDERPSGTFGDSSQLTYWILDSGATCHITTEVSGVIPDLLEDTDKHIEVADGHHVTSKQKGQVQIKMSNDNGDPFIAMLHNLLLAPDLCDRFFSIIKLINSGHHFLLPKGFFTLYFGAMENKCSNITT